MGGKQIQNLAAKTEERISTKSGRKIKGLAALFTIVKTWKQHKCPSVDEWIKKMWYIYTMEYYLFSHRKEQNNTICSNMNEPRGCHTKVK